MEFGHKAQTLSSHSITVKVTSSTVIGVWVVVKCVTPQIQENSEIALASATPTLNCWWKVLRLLDWQRYYYRGSGLCVKLVYNGCEEDVSGEKRECEGRGRMAECNYAGTWVSLRVYHPNWALQCILMRQETQAKQCTWKTIFILAIFILFFLSLFFYSYFLSFFFLYITISLTFPLFHFHNLGQ